MDNLFGDKIKQVRKQRGLTQEKLARSLGYANKGAISHIEKGELDMSMEKFLLFLRKYSVDANDFLGIKNIDSLLKETERNKRKRVDEEKDILVDIDNIVFSYRVAGILINDNKIMLTKNKDVYTIPGGHVHIGEDSKTAIEREFKEETGFDVEGINVITTYENFWKMHNKDCHQIIIFYKLGFKGLVQEFDPNPDNKNTEFVWLSLDELDSINIYPKNIVQILLANEQRTNHYINLNK